MLLDVASILSLPLVAAGEPEVIAGGHALDTPVRWVHVSEQLEISDLLQGGELVLSTGLMVGADPEAASVQLRNLERAGAAGVVVELPAGREPTQAALRRAAADATLPVVILHRRVRFVDLTEAVHRLIVAEQMEQLEASRRIHELFTDLVLSDASAEDIVRAAALELGTPVLLEDPTGRVVEIYSPGPGGPGGTGGVPGAPGPQDPVARTAALRDRAGAGTRELVSVRDSAWGRLVIPGREDPSARHVAQRAAQALAMHLMAERDARDLAQSAHSAFLAELGAWTAGEEAAEERAASLGLINAGRVVPLALRMPSAHGDPLAASRLERELRADLAVAVEQAGATALVGHAGTDTLAVLLAPSAQATRGVTLDRVATALARRGAGARYIGAGPAGSSVLEAVGGLAEASHVAAAAQRLGRGAAPERRWFRAADVRLPGLVAMLADDPRVQRFAAAELGGAAGLTAPGREADLALLRAMVETGGAKARVAARLFLSRPAVYHRLARLEDELGVSLSDPASLASLSVALLVHDVGSSPLA